MTENLFSHCAPVLSVDNAVDTARFYKEKLGFEIAFTYGDPPYYVVVKRGQGVSIHFSEREDCTAKIQPCCVYIFVTNVDAVYDEYLSKGVDVAAPPENQEYGMREFDVVDPNGHFLTFGQDV